MYNANYHSLCIQRIQHGTRDVINAHNFSGPPNAVEQMNPDNVTRSVYHVRNVYFKRWLKIIILIINV